MDYRTNLPTFIPIITFCLVLVLISFFSFFGNPKKKIYFSITSFFSWFICLGIAYLINGSLTNLIAGVFPANILPGEWTPEQIGEFIAPYVLLISQWVLIFVFSIPQILIWHFVLRKKFIKIEKPKHKKTKKSKKPKIKLSHRFFSAAIAPFLALPALTQASYLVSVTTTPRDLFNRTASPIEKKFYKYLEFTNGLWQPSLLIAANDIEGIFSALKLNTDTYNSRKIIEWYGDFFSDLTKSFQEISFTDIDQVNTAMAKANSLIKDWNFVNELYSQDLANMFLSKPIAQVAESEIINLIGGINPSEISKNFNYIVQALNCMINGFSTISSTQPLQNYESLNDFAIKLPHDAYFYMDKIILATIFNDQYSAATRESDHLQFMSYFFQDISLDPISPTSLDLEAFYNLSEIVSSGDLAGSGTKKDPYLLKKEYFAPGVDQKIFCEQIFPKINPIGSIQKVDSWSYETTTPTGELFQNNQWIFDPEEYNYSGSIIASYSGTQITPTPSNESWGITWTANVGSISSTFEFFWRYI